MALLKKTTLFRFAVHYGFSVMLAGLAGASGQSVGEYQVKAAFLFNFAKFVEWPPETMDNSRGPIAICVVGQNPFGQSLNDAVSGKTISGRPIAVRMMATYAVGDGCHILFVSGSERKRLPSILEAARNAGVLTVGDGEGFASEGGMIGFKLDEGKVRFEINLLAAERQKLHISSKLLSLALIVRNARVTAR